MSKESPYFDPDILLNLGAELIRRPESRWAMELDSFNANELGRTKRVPVISTPPFVVPPPSELPWLARVTTKPEAARDWTITLAPLSPGSSQGPFQQQGSGYEPPNVSDAVCIVQWRGGRQGVPAWAVVDWWAGQQFSVFGSSVIVTGAVIALATAAVAANNTHVLGAQLAPGLSRNTPRRTVIYPTLIASGGGNFTFAVPPYAQNVSFSFAGAPGISDDDVLLEGLLILGGTSIWGQTPLVIGALNQGVLSTFRLPIGTNFIRITNNNNNTNLLQARLLYDLALS